MKITKKLTDICLPKQWKTLSLSDLTDEGYLCYGANGIIGHYKEYNHEDEVIMIGCRGSCGSVNISEPKSYINGNAMCLENIDKDVIPKYLYYFLKSCDFGKVITGTSQPQITRTSLSRLDVVIYDMDTQKEIVSILDNVSGLIALTDECIFLLENLAKSQFIEMFAKCDKYVKLSDCFDIHARIGWQSLTKKEHMESGEYYLVTGIDFHDNKIDWSTCCYVSKTRYDMDRRLQLNLNDVLITKDGSIGKVAIVDSLPKPATLNAGVFVVRQKNNMFTKEYVSYLFMGSLFTDFVSKQKTGATIKHLNQERLLKFSFPCPAIEQQNDFSLFVEQIDKSKFRLKQLQEKLDTLYKSLLQKYFG